MLLMPWAARGLQCLGQWDPTPKGGGNLETHAQLGLRAATALMNLESVVIARQHRAVNTVPSLCTHRPSLHERALW